MPLNAPFLSTLNRTFFKFSWGRFLILALLFLFVVAVEMRPSRLYYIVSVLAFRFSTVQLLAFLFLLPSTVWGLLTVLLNRSPWIRSAFAVFFFPVLWLSLTYRVVTGYNFLYADALTFLSNKHLTGHALENFGTQALYGLAITIAVYAVGFLVLRRTTKVYPPAYAWFFVLATLLAAWQIKATAGIVDDYPAAYRVPLALTMASLAQPEVQKRATVEEKPSRQGVRHVMLVVDESITGSLLQLNGYPTPTTPFLTQNQADLVNFGLASAFTNNSAGSNVALLSGALMKELPDYGQVLLGKPNVFQYAKKAGYTTYFFDAQTAGGVMQNFMSREDHAYIDHFVQPASLGPGVPYHQLDFVIADSLLRLAGGPDKVFVYVNKVGAHWPYPATYPADSVFFGPVLGSRTLYRDKQTTLNTYYNSIRWTVDEFWKKLMLGIGPADSTFLVYTSDHGQDFSGNSIGRMHGTIYDSNPQEAEVPLWFLDRAAFLPAGFAPPTPNRHAHEQIFPTLLQVMGYSQEFTRRHYGPSLLDPAPASKRTFMSGDVFGRGTHKKAAFE